MKCPKCKGKMIDDVCIKCGYMKNGKMVQINYDSTKSDLELYERDYDSMIHNKGLLKQFLLGCLYITYKGYFLIGFILTSLEWLISLFVFSFFYSLAYQYQGVFAFVFWFLYFLISRLVISGLLNTLILYLDKKEIERIKKKCPKEYKIILANHDEHGLFLVLMNILIYILMYAVYLALVYG